VSAGERLVGVLAPELAPMLASLEMPANFVPVTNAVLGEMQRRGISRDAILTELRRMGAEIPYASLQMLKVLLRLPTVCQTCSALINISEPCGVIAFGVMAGPIKCLADEL